MKQQAQEIRYFLNGQAFSDGLRTTFAILLPALIAGYLGQLPTGMMLSLGALCISITDAPGPLKHRRNGMLICCALLFITSVITALCRTYTLLLGVEIAVLSFFFSMFSVYGGRAAAVGTAALLLLILQMDTPAVGYQIIFQALMVLCGALWYLVVSLLTASLQPYRTAQRKLGDCIREVANYLSVKAQFYDASIDLEGAYKKLLEQQVTVHEKQEEVREILFKTRRIVAETTTEGRRLVVTFVETVDLFENITAAYYDYAALRERFAGNVVFNHIAPLINEMAGELDKLGQAILINKKYTPRLDFEAKLAALKTELDNLSENKKQSGMVLKKILVNLRRLQQGYLLLTRYFGDESLVKNAKKLNHAPFTSPQNIDAKIFADNLTMQSTVFRHALRVAIACIVGFVIVKIFHYGEHSYWVLLTIAFLLKPAYSLTKQRNIQRITGTVAGGIVGMLILVFIPDKVAQFTLMVLFMVANYTFMRTNYLVMVFCTTPFVLILFNLTGFAYFEVATERLIDTVVGCIIAFSASYFLFPAWEAGQLASLLQSMLHANAAYLAKAWENLNGRKTSMLEYKLVRKEVYVSSANLSAAFQRMLSDPKSKRSNSTYVQQFVVLNHILFSNTAAVIGAISRHVGARYPDELLIPVKKALSMLAACETSQVPQMPAHEQTTTTEMISLKESDYHLLKDQLEYIYTLSADINKVFKRIS